MRGETAAAEAARTAEAAAAARQRDRERVHVGIPHAVDGEKDGMKPITFYEEGDTLPDGKEVGDGKTYSTTEIEPQQLDDSKLIPVLTAALQEAIAKIETLETEVAALKSS